MPAIDDYVGRDAACYEELNDMRAQLNELRANKEISDADFDALWEDADEVFQACRDLVSSDHDMFEYSSTIGMQW